MVCLCKPQIARLVLGYLKSENCMTAFHEFLIKSQYLKSLAVFVKNGKYFATRVGGLTLEDILAEYSEVSLIIQDMLEQTDYYRHRDEHGTKLSNQLLYILDYNSRTSTPTLPKDLNATPSESLPGNSLNISQNSLGRSSIESNECTSSRIEDTSNISTTSQKDHKKTAMAEIDNNMKTIEEKREQDPKFQEILEAMYIENKDATSMGESRNPLDKNQSCGNNIETARMGDNFPNTTKTGDSQAGTCTTNSNIVVLDPNSSKTTTASSQQGQFILANTAGLLMVPSVMGAQNYLLLNSAPTGSSTPIGNMLTENDIMKMPTVILDDVPSARQTLMSASQSHTIAQHTREPPVMTQSQIIISPQQQTTVAALNVQTVVTSSSTSDPTMSHSENVASDQEDKRVKVLAPRTDKITVATSDGDYYKVFDEKGQQEASEAENSDKSQKASRRKSSKQPKKKSTTAEDDPTHSSPERTPPKAKDESLSKKEGKKSVKSLFKDNKKASNKTVWDADLRELLIPKKHQILDTSDDKMDSSDERLDTTDNNLNVTCDDEELKKGALMIEAAFKTPVKTPAAQKNEENADKEEDTTPTIEERSSEETSETGEKSIKSDGTEEVIETEETEVYLRNCNGPARFKKKCNETSTVEILEVEVVEEATLKTEEVEVKFQPGTSNLGLDLMLETPVKTVPKTPGKFEMTPLTRVIEEQLQGMDLLSLSTPKMAITPGFPITPNVELTTPNHHSNRPTDYSTSSSYYQPSDTEQNKSLEMMMEEIRKEERNKIEEMKNQETVKKEEQDRNILCQMKRMFNENVIGKKNLSMMKKETICSGDSSNSSNSSSSEKSSSESDSESDFEESLSKEIISSPKKSSYSFRKRKSPVPKTPNETKKRKPTPSPKSTKKIISLQQEIKEKKERTMRAIKKDDNTISTTVQKRILARNKLGKFAKKSKIPPKAYKATVEKCDGENEITDDDFALHLSTDEDSTNKINNDTVINKNKDENQPKPCTNIEAPATEEAKQLIQGLSERGIYLVPKVSPLKAGPSSDDKKLSSDDENALENLEVSSEDTSIRNEEDVDEALLFQNQDNVTFDTKTYDEVDIINLVYDSSKRRKKKVYDLEVLKKNIKANVYLQDLDMDMVRIIKFTPTQNLFEYFPKKAPVKRRRSVKPDPKPVQMKDKQVKGTNSKSEPETKNVETSTENKERTGEKQKKDLEPEKSPQKKSETTQSRNQRKSSNPKRLRSVDSEPKTISESNEDEKNESVPFEAENVETTVIERLEKEEEDKLPGIGSGDDDLMNFAVLGKVIEEAKESKSCKGGEKRKLSTDGEHLPAEKKCKIENEKNQALLKKVDVDSFLNKVHGDEKPS